MVGGGKSLYEYFAIANLYEPCAALDPRAQRFVAVLATGFVLFTLFINGTTLRLVIAILGLHRL